MLPDPRLSDDTKDLSDQPSDQPSNVTLIEGFRSWLKRKFPHSSTPLHYTSDVRLFFGWFNKPVLATRVADIDAYIQHCQVDGHRSATINRRLATLRVFFDWLSFELEDGDHAISVPTPVIPRRHVVRAGERLPRDVRDADLARLFDAMLSAHDRAMFALMLRCGLRVGEIHALSLQDIYTRGPASRQASLGLARLRVCGKGNKERTAYLSAQADAVLQSWLQVRPAVKSDAVFINRHGQRLSVNGIQFILRRVCEQAGLHITCHQFRHTFGRHMAEACVPVTSIQRLMGHHWLQSTEGYLHLSDPHVQADYDLAMQRIGGQLDLAPKDDEASAANTNESSRYAAGSVAGGAA